MMRLRVYRKYRFRSFSFSVIFLRWARLPSGFAQIFLHNVLALEDTMLRGSWFKAHAWGWGIVGISNVENENSKRRAPSNHQDWFGQILGILSMVLKTIKPRFNEVYNLATQ